MKVLEDQGFCTCCGNFANYKFGQENYSLILKNLDNYKKYKSLFAYKCKNCGFISTDITGTEGVLYGEIKDSYKFKELLNCTYLQNLNEEFEEDYTKALPVGIYEAYSLILLEAKDYEKYIRLINMVIELKESLKRKYRDYIEEVEGDEEIYNKLVELIDKSIKSNREQIYHYYTFLENKNIFMTLVYIENLIGLGKLKEAKVLFESAKEKRRLEEDLTDYFEIKFMQQEK